MSDLRIALVAEGPTDKEIIQSGLKAVLPRPFILTLLQPEPTFPQMGAGWCGVFKWCREFAARTNGSLETDPTLPGFDLFLIHLDADVSERQYSDGGASIESAARDLPKLPCSRPCPPPSDTAEEIRQRLLAWLNIEKPGPRTVLCVPSKAIEAWLAVGVLDGKHALLKDIECNLNVEARLRSLPLSSRIRKTVREYQRHAQTLTANWSVVSAGCTQAARFEREVSAALAQATATLTVG